jgi:hypothetical protein
MGSAEPCGAAEAGARGGLTATMRENNTSAASAGVRILDVGFTHGLRRAAVDSYVD